MNRSSNPVKPRSLKEKGYVLLVGGLMMLFVVPIVGLAVDAGVMYAIKARLQAATDAASLAAARSLAVGLTIADQEQSARERAIAFFNANFPTGMFNTTGRGLVVDIAETAFRTRTVTVTATVETPLYFMRIMRTEDSTMIGAMGQASRRDVNVMMVLDRSGSMNSNGGCPAMRAAANGFLDLFANQRDRLGMITYGISYALSYAPNMNFKTSAPTLSAVVNSITCNGGTGTAQAFFNGYQQLVNINEPGALNVILLFTDGIPNTVAANYRVNVLDTARNADGVGGPTGPNNSRCYDWERGQRWYRSPPGSTGTTPGTQSTNWAPHNQVYRGSIYSQEGIAGSGNSISGIWGTTNTGFNDAGLVSRPFPNESSNSEYGGGQINDCWFRGGYGHTGNNQNTGTNYIQYDIAYMPEQDLYGTSLTSSDNFRVINRFPLGHVYTGKIDIRDRTNIMNTAINAVDNVGKRVRNNDLAAGINTVVYAIGLGEVGNAQHTLLRRVSNDRESPIYDPNKLEGLYVFAPQAADLNAAFVKIAAEILRIAQ